MCGLAGLIRLDSSRATSDDTQTVEQMCDLMVYRGPNDSGIEVIGPAVLGSRRLSIQDLSAAGHMPMMDASKRW